MIRLIAALILLTCIAGFAQTQDTPPGKKPDPKKLEKIKPGKDMPLIKDAPLVKGLPAKDLPTKEMPKKKGDEKAKTLETEEPADLTEVKGKFLTWNPVEKKITLDVDGEERAFVINDKTITYTTRGEPSKKQATGFSLYKLGRPILIKLQPKGKQESVYSVKPLKN